MTLKEGIRKRVPLYLRNKWNRVGVLAFSSVFVIADALLANVSSFGSVPSYMVTILAVIYLLLVGIQAFVFLSVSIENLRSIYF